MKKITIYDEILYPIAIILLAISVAMATVSGFGVSMIVAPAYILSLKLDFLIFGQAEYIIQGILIIILFIAARKIKLIFLLSFLTCLLYGLVLDLFMLIPIFNPNTMDLPLYGRILYFIASALLAGASIAIFVRIYLYPQVYDFFNKTISKTYGFTFFKVKLIFDISSLVLAFILTLLLFKDIQGIGIGTIILAFLNSFIIKTCGILFDKLVTHKPLSEKSRAFLES